MPLFDAIVNENYQIYVWKIEESLYELFASVYLNENSKERLKTMKAESHVKGFLAVRKLLQHINLSDKDLTYDEFGKPCLLNGLNISISHAFDFSVIMISEKLCGVDIEKLKEKMINIGPRFCNENHLNKFNPNIEECIMKYTIAWGIKESIFKIINLPGISFPNHISVLPFELDSKTAHASLHFDKISENYRAIFKKIENYILVWIVADY